MLGRIAYSKIILKFQIGHIIIEKFIYTLTTYNILNGN